jgi:hypothetical protein
MLLTAYHLSAHGTGHHLLSRIVYQTASKQQNWMGSKRSSGKFFSLQTVRDDGMMCHSHGYCRAILDKPNIEDPISSLNLAGLPLDSLGLVQSKGLYQPIAPQQSFPIGMRVDYSMPHSAPRAANATRALSALIDGQKIARTDQNLFRGQKMHRRDSHMGHTGHLPKREKNVLRRALNFEKKTIWFECDVVAYTISTDCSK